MPSVGFSIGREQGTMRSIGAQYLNWLMDYMSIGVVMVDGNGLILDCNQRAQEMLGGAEQALRGAPLARFFPEAKQRDLICCPARSSSEPSPLSEVFAMGGADEKRRFVEVTVAPLTDDADESGAIVLLLDVTDRVNAEMARLQVEKTLHQREELYRQAIAAANAVPYLKDYETNSYPFMGEGILQMTGYTPEEMTPELWERITPEVVMLGEAAGLSVREAMRKALAGELRHWQSESRLITRDGQMRWVADCSVEIFDETGQSTGSVGVLIDITEHKQAQEALQETNRRLEETLAELRAAQQQLVQQERLRALGTMASGIAHDFNNALAPILGYAELLLLAPQDLDDKAKVLRYLQTIHAAAQDAANVVSRLREFYRFRDTAEILLPVDVNHLVEQTVLLTQPKWKDQAQAGGRTIVAQTDLQDVPPVAGNESELREALTNLIFNAVDAMPNGGVIMIRTRMDETGKRGNGETETSPFLRLSDSPIHVVLEVSDTGVGMTEEVRRRCLEPFFSTKGERGSGLGLAVVYGILQRHNGTIEIDSAPGKGTTVVIRLPAQIEPKREDRTTKADIVSRSLRVLVVDDEPRVREVIVEYLRRDGHAVEPAANGREGLEKFRADKFDLVVTDRAMPEMSGNQLALALQQLGSHVPVILLTGFGEFMNAAGEHPAGVDVIVSKPIGLTALREAIAKVVGA